MNNALKDTAEEISPDSPLKILSGLLDHPDYSGIDQDFFSGFHSFESPLLIPDMEKAVQFLKEAIQGKQHISVFGDRDVDGVASTAMLGTFLLKHHEGQGGKLSIRVSDSGDDYGISGSVFSDLLESGADLNIFLDMGSSNRDAIKHFMDKGARVIVLDHHQIPDEGPVFGECAFVNPIRNPDLSRFATVMVCLKFLSAYALSHTKEWETVYFLNQKNIMMKIGDSVSYPGASPEHVSNPMYRLGLFLGNFNSKEAAQDFLSSEYPGYELSAIEETGNIDENSFLGDGDVKKIFTDAENGGKYMLAARIRTMPRMTKFLHELTDLLSVGTIADMMPLLGENRMLTRIGMGYDGIGKSIIPLYRPGYRSLLKILGIKEMRISSRDIGWGISPSLNAAGRMGETKRALDLLLEMNDEKSILLAKDLNRLNAERKRRTSRNESIISAALEENPEKLNHPFIFCYHPDLEPGVSGIVATRLAEQYQKPVVYINPDGPHARGSARTYGGINVLDFIARASEHFIQFGGHPEACGFSLRYEKIEDLEKCLLMSAADLPAIEKEEDHHKYHIEISPEQLTWNLFEEIEMLEPFGPMHPEPRIKISSSVIRKVSPMSEGKHALFSIQGAPHYLECVIWKRGREIIKLHENQKPVNLIGCMEKSNFRGRTSLRFRVEAVC